MAKKGIHRFLKAQILHAYLFGWVMANKKNLPAMSTDRSVMQFKKDFQLTDEDMDTNAAVRQFQRMQSQRIDFFKTEGGNND